MGPRQRNASPAPPLNLPDIQPLNIRRGPSINPTTSSSLSISTTTTTNGNGTPPTFNGYGTPPSSNSLLSPPTDSIYPGRPRSTTPTLQIGIPGIGRPSRPQLKLPKIDFSSTTEGPFAGGYAGGPNNANASPHLPLSANTTDDSGDMTIMPKLTISPTPRPPPISMENIRQTVEEFDKWSDDVLEERLLRRINCP